MRHALGLQAHLHHLLQYRVGALDRRALGQFHSHDQVELVLRRDEAARHGVEHQAGASQQHRIDHEGHAATPEDARHRILVPGGAGLEEAVERVEHPTECAIDATRERIPGRVVTVQQLGRERGRERERVDRRDHGGDRDGHRELLVELAGHAREEGHRHEHRAQHQRDRDDRAGDFLHCLVRGSQWREPLADVAFHVLDHHDRIVDHDADREHQAEQRQRIDREAQHIEHGEGSDHRHRHRDQRNDRGAPGLQEQDHDQHDEQDRLEQRVHHRVDRVAHEDRGVKVGAVAQAGRELLGQLVHLTDHRVAHLQQVGAGRLEHRDDGGGLAVERGLQRVVAGTELDARDVRQAHSLSVRASLEHDFAELLGGAQAALGVDRDQEIAAALHRLGTDLAGRNLDVLLAHRAYHVACSQAARGDLLRVEPDTHRVVAAAPQLDLPNAG